MTKIVMYARGTAKQSINFKYIKAITSEMPMQVRITYLVSKRESIQPPYDSV